MNHLVVIFLSITALVFAYTGFGIDEIVKEYYKKWRTK